MANLIQLTIDEVNTLDFSAFISKFGNVVEQCPVVAAAVCQQRPFKSREELLQSIYSSLDSLPKDVQQGVLMCHPDLAGKLAQEGQLTEDSAEEQAKAGLLSLSPDEFLRLKTFNEGYKSKFGFPFIICVGKNRKEAIFKGIEQRLQNTAEDELVNAMEQVKSIVELRLNSLVDEESPGGPKSSAL